MDGIGLKAIRQRLELTQAQFAERLGITKNSVARQERGELGISDHVAVSARLLLHEQKEGKRMRPHKYTPGQMDKAGVEVISQHNVWLRCKQCGQAWSPNLGREGRLPRGYWRCPNGCNADL